MRVNQINLGTREGQVCLEGQFMWEDTDKEPLKLYVEIDKQFKKGFWGDPNGFLLAALFPAWNMGEKRVCIEGELCPLLLNNIKAACDTIQSWYPELGKPPVIEMKFQSKALKPFKEQAASFLSCGIDSLATIRANKLAVPEDHPLSTKLGIAIDYERPHGITTEEESNRARNRKAAANIICKDAGMMPMVVKTNILRLSDGYFFDYKWHGAAMSAIAHFLSRSCNKIYIASSYTIPHLEPWGSHPLLDPYYSSAHLSVEHHGIEMSRLEKTKLVAQWPVGLNNIQVCTGQNSGKSNCGACEKCIRTMTSLVALGKLKGCHAFPIEEVTPDLLNTLEEYDMIYAENQLYFYVEMIPYLQNKGRGDLISVINRISEKFKKNTRFRGHSQ